mgnify:CR=1 FL=1
MGYDISIKVAEIDNEFKSLCKECYIKHCDKIKASISKFRTKANYNCYAYALYLINKKVVTDYSLPYIYISGSAVSQGQANQIFNTKIYCINDTSTNNIYRDKILNKTFIKKYSTCI